jgi:hypothetical protein
MRRPSPLRSFAKASNDIADVIALLKAGQRSTACPRLGQPAPPAVPAQDDGLVSRETDAMLIFYKLWKDGIIGLE